MHKLCLGDGFPVAVPEQTECLQRVDVGIDPYRENWKFVCRGGYHPPEN